jgi:hypothetical protein
MPIMSQVAISDTLEKLVARYKSLEQICSHSPRNHVLGSSLDAAASVLATRLFEVFDNDLARDLSPLQGLPSARCSQGRDSVAIVPALNALATHTSSEDLAEALCTGMWAPQLENPDLLQSIVEAKRELELLLKATNGANDEISCAARVQGQTVAEHIFLCLSGCQTKPFSPAELDRATDA